MRRREKLLYAFIGAVLAAIFLWPVVGMVQGVFQSQYFSQEGPDSRLAKTAKQFRPDWIPHTGHLLVSTWPAPDTDHDKGCLEEIYRRESITRKNLDSQREPYLRAAIGSWMWNARDEIVEPFELDVIGKRFSFLSGGINGCIEGSIAAPLCKSILRDTMIAEYDRARPRLDASLQRAVNSAEVMACSAMDKNSPLMHPSLSKAD